MRGVARLVAFVLLGLAVASPAGAARRTAPTARVRRPARAKVATPRRVPRRVPRPAALADRAIASASRLGLRGDEAIDAAVERLMDDAKAHGLEVSLSVGALGGRNRNVTSRFAFNQVEASGGLRLVTAAYALDALGPAHRFETALAGDRRGNIYLASSLDPTLDAPAVAGALRDAGVTRIRGDLHLAPGSRLRHDRVSAALAAAGVELAGAVTTGEAPASAAIRAIHTSEPLADIAAHSMAGARIDQELLARAANAVQKTSAPLPDGAAGIARFLGARVRLRRFNREFAIRDPSAHRGNTLSSDQMLAVMRFAAKNPRTAPLLDALGAGPDQRVVAATHRAGAAVSRTGIVRSRGRKADLGFAVLARAPSAAERPFAEAWLDALSLTLARLEPRAPGPGHPAAWPAVPRGKRQLEATFGRPGEYVIRHRLPIGPGGRMQQVRINRKLIPVLEAALAEAAEKGLVRHIERFGGTFKLRTKRRPDGTELQPPVFSTHSYGVSFDINPDVEGGKVHPELGRLFEKYGFVWGKNFAHNYDPMHFQFVADY
jgi:hypothetical protein